MLGRRQALLRADHTSHESEIGREAVVEAVHHVAEETTGAGPVPGLALPTGHSAQRLGVLLGFPRQREGRGGRRAVGGLLVELQVALDLTALFLEQHRQKNPGAKAPGNPGPEAGPQRGAGDAHFAALFGQQLPPEGHMAVFDVRQLAVKPGPVRVALQGGQFAVKEGGVGLVGEVVEPVLEVGLGSHAGS